MSKKEVGQWAYELMAGEDTWKLKGDFEQDFWRRLEAAVRADEREACAKVAKSYDHDRCVYDGNGNVMPSRHGGKIAAAIRARGAKDE